MRWSSIAISAALVAASVSALPVSSAAGVDAPVENDINGDGLGDLLVGVPLESIGANARAGAVNVLLSAGARLRPADASLLTQAAGAAGEVERDDLFGSAVELTDIDGDGYADAIIGSSGEKVGLEVNAGAFAVISGGESGLDRSSTQYYVQGDQLADEAELGDFFGFNIAAGDFNRDGYGDIAVSAPFDDVGAVIDAGTVIVVHGSPEGLDTSTARTIRQGRGSGGVAEAGDFFGWSLTSGDFDADGFDDLVVGSPGEDGAAAVDAGAVTVLYGSLDGVGAERSAVFSQAGRVRNVRESRDLFAFAVAASDLNCDGFADLAVGVPNETLGPAGQVAGLVNVLLGSASGVVRGGNQVLMQGRRGVAGQRDFNQFGAALAAGDFDGDGCGDLAVSAHTTDVGATAGLPCRPRYGCAREAGAVVAIAGGENWPLVSSSLFSQAGMVDGRPQRGDFFGRTLAVVDADGDGRDDLAVGVPREDRGGLRNVGQVTVLRGTASGLSRRGNYTLAQGSGLAGRAEQGDQFGSSLADASS